MAGPHPSSLHGTVLPSPSFLEEGLAEYICTAGGKSAIQCQMCRIVKAWNEPASVSSSSTPLLHASPHPSEGRWALVSAVEHCPGCCSGAAPFPGHPL